MLSPEALLKKKQELIERFKGTRGEGIYYEGQKFLCDTCPQNEECDLAFDAYNEIPKDAGPDYNDYCLAEK